LIFSHVPEETLIELIRQFPNANSDAEQLEAFYNRAITFITHQATIDSLMEHIKYLTKRVRRFMIISNYNWILWSVMQARKPNSDFDYLEYAKLRVDMYKS
jgi:hypothetical protein